MDFAPQTGSIQPVRAKSGSRARQASEPTACQSAMAILDLDWPSPNLWTSDQRADFKDRLLALSGRAGVQYLVLTGPNMFEAQPTPASSLRKDDEPQEAIFNLIASFPLPIIAVIPGDAIGSGLELAIACAARIARPDATLWLGDVRWAQLPGLTALSRLPPMMGVKAATRMIALAQPLNGLAGRSLGLLDALADRDQLQAAELLMMAGRALGAAKTEAVDLQAQFYLARRGLRDTAPDQVAPVSAIRAMEACAQWRPRQAKAEVSRIRDDLARTPEAEALRYAQDALSSLGEKTNTAGVDLHRLSLTLWWPMAREAIHLLDEGASPAQVDRCFCAFGFPIGPFTKADAFGFAQVFTVTGDGLASGEAWAHYSPTLDLMADSGRIGGDAPGWYAPSSQASGSRYDAFVDRLIQNSGVSQRLRREAFGDEAVMGRCLSAAINASFAVLEGHPGLAAHDIDAMWIGHLGFPRWKGGPIYQARRKGLDAVVASLRLSPARMTAGAPCELLLSSAAEGDTATQIAGLGAPPARALSA